MGLRAAIYTLPTAQTPSATAQDNGNDVLAPLQPQLGGGWLDTEDGSCLVTGTTHRLDHVHGRIPVSEFLSLPSGALARVCREASLATLRPEEMLFLDTETTGLSLDGSTVVFMVGVAYFDGDALHVRQFFIHHEAAERTVYLRLRELLADFGGLVTFNGKQFDVPMLRRRAARHQVELGLDAMPHADLLHPARRLWKERLGSCRLSNLERHIVGFRRTGDVPGARIPGLYEAYLRTRDPSGLAPVFYHNVQDILTLLAVSVVAARSYAEPLRSAGTAPLDLYSLGRAFEADGDVPRALTAYHHALAEPLPADVRDTICRRLASLHRVFALTPEAPVVWEHLAGSGAVRSVYPLEQLAKHHEHTTLEYDRAQELLVRALELLERDRCSRTSRRELEKRLTRVRQKAGGHSLQ